MNSIDMEVNAILKTRKKIDLEKEVTYPRAWSLLASAIMKSAYKEDDELFIDSEWGESILELATIFEGGSTITPCYESYSLKQKDVQ